MRDLPSGTVTFLFTDVEGSTKLLHELGPNAYAEALAEHRRVIREACAAEGGTEVDTQGDAFFFAFPTAPGALAAAEAMTEALSSGPIQVRIGLHTGTPLLTDEGYIGDDVHVGARVASSSHGGQVILSAATAELVELELTDLGEHRLKDIAEAVPIYQLGDGSFPPLKTISNTNLPRPASSFVGRERELDDVLSKVKDGARLLTLTGPGGTGKTRLSIEAASELVPDFKAGVFWVGLATLRDPALVTETIAQTLGAKNGVADHIGEREILLLLDNLEQVIDAAPELASLLEACANLKLLVTSRELLRVRGEVEYAVPPLAEPEAVSLFCERSGREASDEISELCARLDSLPLAVELAAARTKALTPTQILERLSQRLDLLKGGRDADPRQQTLRATIEWSYDLLSLKDKLPFARLSVFAGGCTLDAAEEVCDADLDTLQSLVEKSLLRFTDGRYWMLETIRKYANELGDSSAPKLKRRHAEHYLSLAEAVEERKADDPAAYRRLDEEDDNFRSALSWFVESNESDAALRLVAALADHWVRRAHVAEARSHVEAALAIEAPQSPSLRARALAIGSDFARFQGDIAGARAYCEESLALARQHGDGGSVGRALHELGEAAMAAEEFDDAVGYFEEAVKVARDAGLDGAGSTGNLGYVALLVGDYERAITLSDEALASYRSRASESLTAVGLTNKAQAIVLLGRTEEALPLVKESLALARDLGFVPVIAEGLESSAALLTDGGNAELAARLTGAADALRDDIGLSLTETERRVHHRMQAALEAALDDHQLERLREEGRQLSAEEAVALALGALDA